MKKIFSFFSTIHDDLKFLISISLDPFYYKKKVLRIVWLVEKSEKLDDQNSMEGGGH